MKGIKHAENIVNPLNKATQIHTLRLQHTHILLTLYNQVPRGEIGARAEEEFECHD